MRLPAPRVRGLARVGRGTVSARATGGSVAPRLGQFDEACLVLRLGQPVDPGRAALRPPPGRLHVIAIGHPVGTGNRAERPLGTPAEATRVRTHLPTFSAHALVEAACPMAHPSTAR